MLLYMYVYGVGMCVHKINYIKQTRLAHIHMHPFLPLGESGVLIHSYDFKWILQIFPLDLKKSDPKHRTLPYHAHLPAASLGIQVELYLGLIYVDIAGWTSFLCVWSRREQGCRGLLSIHGDVGALSRLTALLIKGRRKVNPDVDHLQRKIPIFKTN